MRVVKKVAYSCHGGMPTVLAVRYSQLFGAARRILAVGCVTDELGHYRPHDATKIFGVNHDPGAAHGCAGTQS